MTRSFLLILALTGALGMIHPRLGFFFLWYLILLYGFTI